MHGGKQSVVTWRDFYAFNLRLAAGNLARQAGWKRLANGLEYWRSIAYPLVFNSLDLKEGSTLLDVGSRNTIFPLFVRSKGIKTWATDIEPSVVQQKVAAERLGLGNGFTAEVQDARCLSYPDSYFSAVSAISAVEHIPDDGDSQAVREMVRVVRPGGLVVIDVPSGLARVETDRRDGFARFYDSAWLQERLIQPSGAKVERVLFFAELEHSFWKHWQKWPLLFKVPLLWSQALLAQVFVHMLSEEELSFRSPAAKKNFLETAGAVLVLRK